MRWSSISDWVENIVVALVFCIYVLGAMFSIIFVMLFTVLTLCMPYIIVFGVFALFLYILGYAIF